MGQTSSETKRQVEETRAHLQGTLEALEFKARRNLDVRYQLQHSRATQAALSMAIIALAGAAAFLVVRRRRRSPAELLVRRLKLDELRNRLSDFRDDARAWGAAQRRILKADGRTAPADHDRRESVARRLLVSAAEAALTAAATGMVKRLLTAPSRPSSERAATPMQR